jgi:hypothetical protein
MDLQEISGSAIDSINKILPGMLHRAKSHTATIMVCSLLRVKIS